MSIYLKVSSVIILIVALWYEVVSAEEMVANTTCKDTETGKTGYCVTIQRDGFNYMYFFMRGELEFLRKARPNEAEFVEVWRRST